MRRRAEPAPEKRFASCCLETRCLAKLLLRECLAEHPAKVRLELLQHHLQTRRNRLEPVEHQAGVCGGQEDLGRVGHEAGLSRKERVDRRQVGRVGRESLQGRLLG